MTRITSLPMIAAAALLLAAAVAAPVTFDVAQGGFASSVALAKKGADDGAKQDARGRGRGADDGAGHNAGDDRGGRGRGADDPAGHR